MNENHAWHSTPVIINWDTTFFDTQKEQDEFYYEFYRVGYQDSGWWERKEAVEEFLASKNIPSYYYWGWHEPDYDPDTPHEDRRYSCWEPVCEDGWWDKTHYYLDGGWSNQNGIYGDWDRYGDLFSKLLSDDYLITYLRSQNVQPETWYTRARIWMGGNTLMFQYYNGDSEANESHSAPACNTKSLSKIKNSIFDSDYWGYGYFWERKRTTPRN